MFVFLLQIHPIRKLYLLNMTLWLDVFRVGVKNSYWTVLWPWHYGYTNNIRLRNCNNRKIFILWFTTIIWSKNGNILSFNEIILSNIYTRSSVITSNYIFVYYRNLSICCDTSGRQLPKPPLFHIVINRSHISLFMLFFHICCTVISVLLIFQLLKRQIS